MRRRLVLGALAVALLLGLLAPTIAPANLLGPAPSLPGAAVQWADVAGPGEALPGSDLPVSHALSNVLPTGTAPADADGTPQAPPTDTPFVRLLAGLTPEAAADPARLIGLIQDYYHEVGFNVPAADAGEAGSPSFEENSTLSYSYEVDDINADGIHDVLMDTYCTDGDSCPPGVPGLLNDPANVLAYLGGTRCGPAHRIYALSGADGQEVWWRRLDRPHLVPGSGCSIEFVAGTAPTPDGRPGLLVLRYEVLRSEVDKIDQSLYLLDPENGRPLWYYNTTGTFTIQGAFSLRYFRADNFLLNPILQVPSQEGVRLVSPATQPSLHVQSVGFRIWMADDLFRLPTNDRPYPLIDSYEPVEWLAKIDFKTGREAWKVNTYVPDVDAPLDALPVNPATELPVAHQSTLPSILETYTLSLNPSAVPRGFVIDPGSVPGWQGLRYWRHVPCCFDSTGDGIPDIVYTDVSWNSYPSSNSQGPYWTNAHLRLVDGSNGATVWNQLVVEDAPIIPARPAAWFTGFVLHLYVEFLGDATGDGAADVLLHIEYVDLEYRRVLTIRDGRTGSEAWRLDTPRIVRTLVLGDTDGDGGNDLLVTDWYPTWLDHFYSYTNVTHTPLTVYNGRDGHQVWKTTTFTAPADLEYWMLTLKVNGLPDFDGDGVGDIPVDDPLYMPDLTVVHRMSFVSGRTAQPLFRLIAAGAFAFPSQVGDITGDGRDDLALLNGDTNDLWITLSDGATGTALWSRRILALRVYDAATILPRLRYHLLDAADPQAAAAAGLGQASQAPSPVHPVLLVNFQMGVTQAPRISTTTPQIAAYDGGNGSVSWAVPAVWDPSLTVLVPGLSPASYEYATLLEPAPRPLTSQVVPGGLGALVGASSFGGAFLASLYLASRRWFK